MHLDIDTQIFVISFNQCEYQDFDQVTRKWITIK